jgi:cell division protein FtsA
VTAGCARRDLVGDEEYVEVQRLGEEEPRELPRWVLAEIIEPRMRELFDLVGQEIEKVGGEEFIGGTVVLTGGGAQLAGTLELAAEQLGMPARIGTPRNIGGLAEAVDSPVFATAVGLVQYGAAQWRARPHVPRNGSLVSAALERVSRFFLRLSKHG